MATFKEFFAGKTLSEKLITFGGKAYPKFGQVLILAGGSGSGKGFVLDNIVGIEGNVIDVDTLKRLAVSSTKFAARVEDDLGYSIKSLDLTKPENVSKIHTILSDMFNITGRNEQRLFAAALSAPADRKPNLIFDVTLKDLTKLESISRNVLELGYDKENIHLVWVINDIKVANKQNKERSRVVSDEILQASHEGVSQTMAKLVSDDTTAQKYLDGDIWFVFNKAGADVEFDKSDAGGRSVTKANYVKVKEQGSQPTNMKDLDPALVQKIVEYTPKTINWQ